MKVTYNPDGTLTLTVTDDEYRYIIDGIVTCINRLDTPESKCKNFRKILNDVQEAYNKKTQHH